MPALNLITDHTSEDKNNMQVLKKTIDYVFVFCIFVLLCMSWWHKFPDIFLPYFFSFAIESYKYKTDFALKKYHF